MYGQFVARRSPLAARRSPLTPRPARAPHEQQPTNLRSRRRPSRLLPLPPPHATMVEMVRMSSPPRRATRCRHPENSLTSSYRASRLLSVPRRSTATITFTIAAKSTNMQHPHASENDPEVDEANADDIFKQAEALANKKKKVDDTDPLDDDPDLKILLNQ